MIDVQATFAGYRLVHTSSLSPGTPYGDLAPPDDYAALVAIQALTNPRLLNEAGKLALLRPDETFAGVENAWLVTTPFTHINRDGSRFSDGSFGAMYLVDSPEVAVASAARQQAEYWSKVDGLCFDRFVYEEVWCEVNATGLFALADNDADQPLCATRDLSYPQTVGVPLRLAGEAASIQYLSPDYPGSTWYCLFTPKHITGVERGRYIELIWDGEELSEPAVLTFL